MKYFLILMCSFSLQLYSQSHYHLEGRFCGLENTRSVVAEMQSPFFGAWTRFVNYPGPMLSDPEFSAGQGALGYTALVEAGLPNAKFVFGNVDGEWVKGIHISGEDENGRFRSHLLIYHRPPTSSNAFRLDGEFSLEHFLSAMNGGSGPKYHMGALLRIECYEPAPIAFHTGLALKRTAKGKKRIESARKPGGDFIEGLDPYFLNSFKSRSYSSDWTLNCGPTIFMDWSVGGNLSLRYLF